MSDLKLEGVYVPVVTPFDADEGLDLSTLTKVIDFRLDGGVRGIVSCGTTGEYYAMSSDERESVMAHTAEVVGERAQLVAGCNAGSTREAIRLAEVAITMGYDAIMLARTTHVACRRSASWRLTTGPSPTQSTSPSSSTTILHAPASRSATNASMQSPIIPTSWRSRNPAATSRGSCICNEPTRATWRSCVAATIRLPTTSHGVCAAGWRARPMCCRDIT